jgi:hypothetical protein
MFPHERSLVARMKDEPFALIGVNSDKNLEELQPKLKEEQITWRSFWNGAEGTGGPISKRWGINGWPTLYLIDAKGKIRHKFLGNPGDEKLDGLIDELVKEAKAQPKKG